MDHSAQTRARNRRTMVVGLALSVLAHAALFAGVDFRVPVGSTDEDVVRLATSVPAAPEERAPAENAPPEVTRVLQLSAPAASDASGVQPPAGAAAPAFRPLDASAAPVPVAASAGADLSAAHAPVLIVHPSTRRVTRALATDAATFSARAAPATATTAAAPPLYASGDVADAKERWAEAAGVGARGIALRVGMGGGGACGIPGRGPVTSWF